MAVETGISPNELLATDLDIWTAIVERMTDPKGRRKR